MRLISSAIARLNTRSGVKAAIINIGWLASERVVRMLGGALLATVVARYLGPAKFGILNYGTAIYLLFNVVSNLGLDQVIVKELTLHPEKEAEVLGTGFILKSVAGAATTALAVASTFTMTGPEAKTTRLIVAILSIAGLSTAIDVAEYFFLAQAKSKYVVGTRQASLLAASAARVWAVALNAPLIAFCWIQAGETLIAEVGLAFAYKLFRLNAGTKRRWHYDGQVSRNLLKDGWPLMAASVLIMVYMRSDLVLLGILSTPKSVGEYSAALKLSEIWYSIPSIIAATVMPKLLQSRAANPSEYYKRLQRFYDFMAALSIVLAIGVGLSSPIAITLFYGRQFSSASPILAIHIWTGVFFFLGVVSSQQGVHEGLSRLQVPRCALGASVNIGLNFVLIPQYGAKGSAIATLVAQGVSGYFGDYLDVRSRHMFWMKSKAYVGYSFWRRRLRTV